MKRIFGSNYFLGSIRESTSYGAQIGTYRTIKSIIRYGSFDEYHFFILNRDAGNPRGLKKDLVPYQNDKRIQFIETSRQPEFLAKVDYTIFFHPDIPINRLVDLRTTYAKKYYPICCTSHTISYTAAIHEVLLNITSDLHSFDSTICSSEASLKALKNIYNWVEDVVPASLKPTCKMRFDHFPLGVDVEDYSKVSREEARKFLSLPVDKTIILNFGRFSIFDKADLQPLLSAFKHLLSFHDNVLLVLAGSNFQSRYDKKVLEIAVEMGIADSVKFYLNPSLEEKSKLYSASDIFISVSDNLQESFGFTLLEAMASGLPAVVSHWDGYKDLVIHNETGFHIPTYWMKCDEEVLPISLIMGDNAFFNQWAAAQSVCVDPKKITEYLSLLVGNPELRRRFGEEGRKRAASEYDWSVIIPKYEEHWLHLSETAKTKGEVLRKPALYSNFLDCFHHYPTELLNEDTKIRLTDEGVGLLKTKKLPSGQPPMNILTPHIVFLILLFLYDKREARIGELTGYVQSLMKNISFTKVHYHIMWMLKKYLLEKM